MNYQHAVDRLWNHSNLPKSFSSENESLIFCLYIAERNNQPPQITSLVEDVIHCLELVNKELNGPNPSETFGRTNLAVLEQVSYPISGESTAVYCATTEAGTKAVSLIEIFLMPSLMPFSRFPVPGIRFLLAILMTFLKDLT